jgi:hypothetical protein
MKYTKKLDIEIDDMVIIDFNRSGDYWIRSKYRDILNEDGYSVTMSDNWKVNFRMNFRTFWLLFKMIIIQEQRVNGDWLITKAIHWIQFAYSSVCFFFRKVFMPGTVIDPLEADGQGIVLKDGNKYYKIGKE